MSALQADLTAKLDVSGLVTTFVGSLTGARGQLEGIAPPASPEGMAQVSGSVQLDGSGIAGLASSLAGAVAPALASLPGGDSVLAPLLNTLELVEAATTEDLPAKIRQLMDKLAAELDQPAGSGFAGTLAKLVETAAGAPEGQLLWRVLSGWLAAGGLDPQNVKLPLTDLVGAIDAAVKALGGLMSLETVLAEAERLTAILAAQLDSGAVNARADEVLAALADGGPVLSLLAALDADDPAEVEAAAGAIVQVSVRLGETLSLMSDSMGMGEATLVYLDLPQLHVQIERSTALVRAADTAAITRLCGWLGDRLGALLGIDLGAIAEQTFDQVFAEFEARAGEIAATIESAPVEGLATPIRAGVAQLQEVTHQLTAAIDGVVLTVRTALEQVRAAIAALPLDAVAAAVRTTLQPVTDALAAITGLVAEVEAAVGAAAGQAVAALHTAEAAVTQFETAVTAAFEEAAEFVDGLHLDAVAGQVAGNVQAFSDLLAQADLQPTFDSVSGAIDSTASVIEQVPFSLLPDSMEQEVVDALRPVSTAQPRVLQAEVLLIFKGPNGESFQEFLRAQVEDVQALYDQLLTEVRRFDAHQLAADLDAELADLADSIREISPQVGLEPVSEAIASLKSAVASLDLDAQLQPLRDAFAQVLSTLDQYSPGALVQPVEQRLDEAREKLIADLKLRELGPKLDEMVERGKQLLDALDPALAEQKIRQAFEEAGELVDGLEPAGGIGTLVAAFLSGTGLPVQPSAFDVVVTWLRGGTGSSALTGRSGRVAEAVTQTLAAVQAVDPAALLARLTPRLQALRRAIEGLSGDARVRLSVAVEGIVPQELLARLAANRDRYLALLGAAAAATDLVRRTGLSEADAVVVRLRAAIDPVRALTAFFENLLRRTGVPGIDGGVAGIARAVLAMVPPERIAALATPILTALHGRFAALLDALAAPLKEGIDELIRVIETLDLTPLRESLDGVHQEVRGQIAALSPDALLGDLLTGFRDLQTEVAGFDPLAPLLAVLTELQDTAARVLGRLDAEVLLAEPLRIYDEILALLGQLDLEVLVGPVIEQLAQIEVQVETGLEQTVTAFERLQEALPDQVGSTSLSVSVSGSLS